MPAKPAASFVIATRNRKDVLIKCLTAAFSQTVPIECLVFDDGSSDGSEQAIAEAFPPARYPNLYYEKHAGGNGPCRLRNRGIEMARAEIVFPLDDDAVMTSPDTVEHVIREFSHPRVAVVAIPVINVNGDNVEFQRAPDNNRVYVTTEYLGASHAVHRDKFLACGGYREPIFQYCEEGDVCMRLLARGHVCRVGTSAPIHHHESPSRDRNLQIQLASRNNVFLAWCSCPMPLFPVYLLGTSITCLTRGIRTQTIRHSLIGIAQGYRMILSRFCDRNPVSCKSFMLCRRLRRHAYVPLAEIESNLPPLQATTSPARPVAPD